MRFGKIRHLLYSRAIIVIRESFGEAQVYRGIESVPESFNDCPVRLISGRLISGDDISDAVCFHVDKRREEDEARKPV